MVETTTPGDRRPRLHGNMVLTRLAGAGVALQDLATPATPDRILLQVGDAATHVTLDGTLDEVEDLWQRGGLELARLRESRLRQRPR